MGDKGGTTTTVQQVPTGPTQLTPESRQGYLGAQSFYQNVLQNPPVYPGPRLAAVTPAQQSAINQTNSFFGTPQPLQLATEQQLGRTIQGGYLGGPEAQAAISSAAQPLFSQFTQQVLPGIRDRAQLAGQGVASSRRGIAEQNAIGNFAQQLGSGVVAPVYNQERQNMLAATGQAPSTLTTEAARLAQLRSSGEYERGLGQQYLDVARQAYEEPLFRQSEAASALGGLAGYSPGGTLSKSQSLTTPSTADTVTGAATTALLAASLAKNMYGSKGSSGAV